ncbi:MAG: radical SAM family heme chaperone HemW [Rickettsiales bacterium]|nr:radical SAM family heme chaperone HemW [Rickettsiales bacterium]
MQTQPLAVYIHWPFCKSKCPYCDFNSHVREAVDQERWKKALLTELRHMAVRTPGRVVTSIFFGGGTPSLMPPATAQALIDEVQKLWKLDPAAEITLEANPTSVEANTFPDFAAAGINRVSLGVQSLRAEALKFLGREHSADEALRAIDRARSIFSRYSFDLIYARPGQTVEAWQEELGEALRYMGSHLSLYQLTIEPNTAFHHAYGKQAFALPDDETAASLYQLTEDTMAAHGLVAYEVSNYAKPGEESRHNLTYWLGGDYVGIGPGAHGRVVENSDKTRIATQTLKSPERWLEAVEREGHGLEIWQEVPARETIEERVMMGLRLTAGIEHARFAEQTGTALLAVLSPKAYRLATEQGLLEDDGKNLRATLSGRLVLSSLTAELLS